MATDPYSAIYRSTPPAPRQRSRMSALEQQLLEDRDNQIRLDLMTGHPPEQLARENKVSRATGVPPAMISDVDTAERAVNADRMTQVAGRYPAFGRWAANNPRAAATAIDDHENLSLLGSAFEGLKKAGRRMAAGTIEGVSGFLETDDLARSPLGTVFPVFRVANDLSLGARLRASTDMRSAAAAQRDKGRGDTWVTDALLSGLEFVPMSAAAALTRNPRMAAAIPAMAVRGNSVAEGRSKGLTGNKLSTYASLQGSIEYLTERLPMGTLADAVAKKNPIGQTFAKFLAEEIPGEQAATLLQDLTDYAFLPENRDKTFSDFLRERPGRAAETAIATVGGGGATVAALKGTEYAYKAGGEAVAAGAGLSAGGAMAALSGAARAAGAESSSSFTDDVVESARSAHSATRYKLGLGSERFRSDYEAMLARRADAIARWRENRFAELSPETQDFLKRLEAAKTPEERALIRSIQRTAGVIGKVAPQMAEAVQAQESAKAMDRLGKVVRDSSYAKRDPEGFSELVQTLAEDAGVTSMFVPCAALGDYMAAWA